MTNLTLSEISIFASRNGFSPESAIALPAIFDNIAEKMAMPVRQIISMATYSNQPLADYIKEVAEQVTA